MIPNNVLLKADREIMKSKQSFGQNLGGTDHIGAPPTPNSGEVASPRPPEIYAPGSRRCRVPKCAHTVYIMTDL